jgi:hypothetical protein
MTVNPIARERAVEQILISIPNGEPFPETFINDGITIDIGDLEEAEALSYEGTAGKGAVLLVPLARTDGDILDLEGLAPVPAQLGYDAEELADWLLAELS